VSVCLHIIISVQLFTYNIVCVYYIDVEHISLETVKPKSGHRGGLGGRLATSACQIF